jgi:hypothetical protein
MPNSPPPMSARDQRAANRNAEPPAMPAKPKSTSRKRQQSNADESANKRNKTIENDSDDGIDDAAIAVEEANEAGKGGKKGKKGKKTWAKGKNKYYFIFLSFVSSHSLTTSSRKTWADRQQEDQIENAKGTPARLQPCVFFLFNFIQFKQM